MYSCKCLGLTDPPPSCRPKQLNAWKGSLALKGPLGGGQCARPPGNHSCRPRAGRLRSPRLPTSRPPPPCAQEVGLFTFTSRWARLPPVVTTPWLPGPAGFSPPESKGPYPWGPASQPSRVLESKASHSLRKTRQSWGSGQTHLKQLHGRDQFEQWRLWC